MDSVRQKEWPAKTVLFFISVGRGNRSRRSAGSRYAIKSHAQQARRRKNDVAVLVPCAAASRRRVAQRLHRTAREIKPLEFSVGEESQRPAIGRPEGKIRPLGVRYAACLLCARFINPQQIASLGFWMADNRNTVAIRRYRHVLSLERKRRGEVRCLLRGSRTQPQKSNSRQSNRQRRRQ